MGANLDMDRIAKAIGQSGVARSPLAGVILAHSNWQPKSPRVFSRPRKRRARIVFHRGRR